MGTEKNEICNQVEAAKKAVMEAEKDYLMNVRSSQEPYALCG